MRSRLAVVVLAGTAAVAIAAETSLRSLPIIIAVAVLSGVTLIRPGQRLCELLAATTVAIGCLSSFTWALVSVLVALLTVAFWSYREQPSDTRRQTRRFLTAMPVAAVTIGLLVAIGLGDRRLDPANTQSGANTDRAEPSDLSGQPDITRSDRTVSARVETISDRGVPIELAAGSELEARSRAIEAALAPYEDGNFTFLAPGESRRSIELIDVSGASGSGDGMSDRLPWLLALVAMLIGVYSLAASRRFGRTPIVVTGPANPPDPSPLEWYDRIVEQAGHQRHPSDPVLRHSRRVAGETGDERFRDLGRIVSDHLYSGRSLTDADAELISRLHDGD